MICENCGKNTATTVLRESINGNVTQKYVCSSCMETIKLKGIFNFGSDFENAIASFLGLDRTQQGKQTVNRCPSCNVTLEEISKRGKIGCAACYKHFKNELTNSIARIHGNVNHSGKIPKSADAAIRKKAEIRNLKGRLDAAVTEQNFEEAVILRDKIRELEGN